jgi:hypothetical protein
MLEINQLVIENYQPHPTDQTVIIGFTELDYFCGYLRNYGTKAEKNRGYWLRWWDESNPRYYGVQVVEREKGKEMSTASRTEQRERRVHIEIAHN